MRIHDPLRRTERGKFVQIKKFFQKLMCKWFGPSEVQVVAVGASRISVQMPKFLLGKTTERARALQATMTGLELDLEYSKLLAAEKAFIMELGTMVDSSQDTDPDGKVTVRKVVLFQGNIYLGKQVRLPGFQVKAQWDFVTDSIDELTKPEYMQAQLCRYRAEHRHQ